ncbi:ABC transporter ATP-binding protein [Anaerotignum propionicum]|jgi:putative ABC transport system ATP-binding protein|uniref:ABC transport system ATP-binding protein n=1 Tax=Anaerotignum propionicum DSM 1682 TaxID=991789 RepID=A0A0X1U6S4_ANAPI|nr:ATP-binding cassette domain-containing protein [Anaerotignum propionicum]AMJ40647.1 ABC transporter ATP-binding protein YxdL [Anaerotignum propionicum DSM 1682]SHE91005.1 putative ABC transport system ATP-binding protein [[Clostridium] propionicum DSM 1682] [Anaerotignum propionicum DSM 1682]
MLELKNITKIYNPGQVTEMCLFDKFNLTVGDGQFVSIVGSNGSGKTSMLNIICGSIPIEGGEVLVGGKDIAKMKDFQRYRSIGRVYQNPSMGTCPNLTMLENMSLADNKGKTFGLSFGINKARENFYKEQLSILGLGLENKMDVKVGALSGGQRQAAALIMSTLTPIEFLILDEHTAALDPKTAEIIMDLTAKVVKEKNLTAMMVTHNLRYAVEYGNRLVMMDKGGMVMDLMEEEKSKLKVQDILDVFTSISIECGN